LKGSEKEPIRLAEIGQPNSARGWRIERYQVSDTSLTTNAIRREVLLRALLSFVLAVVVVTASIRLIFSLAR
jgi:hypothetical protein